jgi:hypothetical protein
MRACASAAEWSPMTGWRRGRRIVMPTMTMTTSLVALLPAASLRLRAVSDFVPFVHGVVSTSKLPGHRRRLRRASWCPRRTRRARPCHVVRRLRDEHDLTADTRALFDRRR